MTLKRAVALCCLLISCKTTNVTEGSHASRCGADQSTGGSRLQVDGGSLWYKAAGDPQAPTVVFLHGGPGYNSYAFEKAVGQLLEPRLRMVYLDQRGCGRSWFAASPDMFGMTATVEDLERLRAHLGPQRIFLMGHSFGGLVALEYERAHPEHVAGLILVETTGNISEALQHQLQSLASMSPERFPAQAEELSELARSTKPPFERIGAAYRRLGRIPLQRALHFASDEGQTRNEALDAESGLLECNSGPVVERYFKDGVLDSPHPELMKRLEHPSVVFGGRQSNVIGEELINASARLWGAPVQWFEKSGHFVYVEEPEAFSKAVISFVTESWPPLPSTR